MKAGLASGRDAREATSRIRRSPEDIWAFVVDHNDDSQSCKMVKSVELARDHRWTVTHEPVWLCPLMILALEQFEGGSALVAEAT